jgi:DNA-binding NtrC family response regulator
MTPHHPEYPPQCTVYLIDDDRAMVQSTAQWLSLCGLKVRSFADPVSALKRLSRGMACVIISDIRMPQMDGMDLLRHVVSKDRNIPVILITGHGDVPLAVEAIKAGAMEFLTKPFSPEHLLEITRAAIKQRIETLKSEDYGSRSRSSASQARRQHSRPELAEDTALAERVDQYEKRLILESLSRHSGNVVAVMEELELPRRTLNAKMKKYGISRRDVLG